MVKKNKGPRTTINFEAVKKDVDRLGKQIAQQDPSPMGRELAPGTVRRESPLEQELGSRRYKEMIHKHNQDNRSVLDRLPFTFPRKKIVRSHLNVVACCEKCGYQAVVSENTIGIDCPVCKTYQPVFNPEREKRYGKNKKIT